MKFHSLLSLVSYSSLFVATIFSPLLKTSIAFGQTDFNCGSHFLTYRVEPLDERQGNGVRCLKIDEPQVAGLFYPGAEGPAPNLSWYGEGRWNGISYRHLGWGVYALDEDDNSFEYAIGRALDIYGNGEGFNNQASDLSLEFVGGNGVNPPTEVRVTGQWNERWIRTSGFSYEALSRPYTCGPNFHSSNTTEYRASSLSGNSGTGIRCLFRAGALRPFEIWFGSGDWNGNRYTHLGWINSEGRPLFAADLCGQSFGAFCGTTSRSDINESSPQQGVREFTGAWNERWEDVSIFP